MSWFGLWDSDKETEAKNSQGVDTSKFEFAYEYYLLTKNRPEPVEEDGYELAKKVAADFLAKHGEKLELPQFKDTIRYAQASSSGGIGA